MEGGLLLLYMFSAGLMWLSYGLIIAAFFVNIFDRNNVRVKITRSLLCTAFALIIITLSFSPNINADIFFRDILIQILLLAGIAISWLSINKRISFTFSFTGLLFLIIDNIFFAAALVKWRELDSQVLLKLGEKYPSIGDFFGKINNLRALMPEMQFHSWSMYYFYIVVILLFAFAIVSSLTKQQRSWLLGLLIIPIMLFVVIYRDNLILNKYIKDIEITKLLETPESKFSVHAIKFDNIETNTFKLSIVDPKNDKVINPPMADMEEVISTILSPDGKKAAYISSLSDKASEKSYWVKYFDLQTNEVKTITKINGYTFNFDVDWKNNLVAVGSYSNNSEDNVTVYNFNGVSILTEEKPTKIFFFGDKKLYLVQGQTPEFFLNEIDMTNGQKTKIATLGGGGFNQNLSYKAYSTDPNKVYITLNDKNYIFDAENSKLTLDEKKNLNGWITHEGGLKVGDAAASVDFSPNQQNYLIRLSSNKDYERIYLKSENNDFFYRFPYGVLYNERFLGAMWLDNQYFIGQSFQSCFIGNVQGNMEPLESTKIWALNIQADVQLPYRHGLNWTD